MRANFAIDESIGPGQVRIGLVEAESLAWGEALRPFDPGFAALVRQFPEQGIPEARKIAVRNLLRFGTYKPAGRGKPSSEYLAQAAAEGDFPAVNYFVDAANIVSLVSGYPISIIDLDKSGHDLLLRRGRAGESYAFNPGGQVIDLVDLLCVCRATPEGWVPTANPVRDSMATKLFPGAGVALAIIYAPGGFEGRDLETACASLAEYLGGAACGRAETSGRTATSGLAPTTTAWQTLP